jgi:eukaryotic-like serine/threonine-protein kinase
MNSNVHFPTGAFDPLDGIIAEYLQAIEAGKAPSRETWLAQHPEHAERLRAFLKDWDAVGQDASKFKLPASIGDGETVGFAPTTSLPTLRYLGDYELVSEIARGGMGVVYRARQVSLNRTVAIKMILAGTYATAQAVQRFRAEAEAAANLDHPNILPIYEVGEHEGHQYFSMKLVEGGSLSGKIEELKSQPKQIASLMSTLARAVHFAHQRGILHRDLKPANVLLDQDGTPFITDFGLAKKVNEDDGSTRTGSIVGTPSYMAPEQARGEKGLTTSVDIYSLGAILYEMLTGKPPFKGETVYATVKMVLEQEPTKPDGDRDLGVIALKCLSKDASKRYGTASELADDLRRWLDGEPITARPAGKLEQATKWVKRNRKLAVMGLAVLLTMALATAVSLGFGLYAGEQAAVAKEQKQKAENTTGQLSRALADKTTAEEQVQKKAADLAAQLTESQRRLDLAFLSEAAAALDRNANHVARDKLDQIGRENRCIGWGLLHRRCLGSEITLVGHPFGLRQLVLSPDGHRVVIEQTKDTLGVWDITTGQKLHELKGAGELFGKSFSPDGKTVVSRRDGSPLLWDAATGRLSAEWFRFDEGELPYRMQFSPDGKRIVTYCGEGETKPNILRLWDAVTGEPIRKWPHPNIAVNCLEFSPDGKTIATGGTDSVARLWDADTGRLAAELKGHTNSISSIAFSADGRRVVTASVDDTPRVWDAATGGLTAELKGHTAFATVAHFTPDGTKVITGSHDKTARLWDAATGRPLAELTGHTDRVESLAVSPDGRRVATAGRDRILRVWDTATGRPVGEFRGHSGSVHQVTFTPDGRRLVTASGDGTAKVWDATVGQTNVAWSAGTAGVKMMAVSADGGRLITADTTGTARTWDIASGRELAELPSDAAAKWSLEKKGPLTMALDITPDGNRAVTTVAIWDKGWLSGGLRVWDAATGKVLADPKDHPVPVMAARFSPDGERLATGLGAAGAVRVWDPTSGKQLAELKRHDSYVSAVAFSPDGKRVVSGGMDNKVRLWDAATGKPLLFPFAGHSEKITAVEFSPDGRRVVSGSEDTTARVWSPDTGGLAILKGHTGPVVGVAFSPDGKRVLTAGDTTVRVWDAATGQALIELKGPGKLTGLGLSADGGRIVVTSEDGQVRQWEVDMADRKLGEPIPERELARRKWIARPRPEVHAKLAEEYKEDPFASAVQKSLEQTALGKLALEAGDKAKADDHFRTAEQLRPKPAVPEK